MVRNIVAKQEFHSVEWIMVEIKEEKGERPNMLLTVKKNGEEPKETTIDALKLFQRDINSFVEFIDKNR